MSEPERKSNLPPGPGPGRPKGSFAAPPPPTQLRDMRKVYKTEKPKEKDQEDYELFPGDTPGMAQWRLLLRHNRKEFMDRLLKAEGEYRDQVTQAKREARLDGGTGEVDAGGAKVVEIIERLLTSWEEIQDGSERIPATAAVGAKKLPASALRIKSAGPTKPKKSGKGKQADVGEGSEEK